jgi:hypothetical protein
MDHAENIIPLLLFHCCVRNHSHADCCLTKAGVYLFHFHCPAVGLYATVLNQKSMSETFFAPYFERITEEEKIYYYFVQEVSTAHTANYCINAFSEMLEDRLMCHRFWSAR